MKRRSPSRVALVPLLVLASATACGKKGPPQAPLIIVPAAAADVSATRLGDRAIVRFNPPEKNTDNSSPADLARVEIYALSVADAASAPEPGVVVREGTRVGSIEFKHPPPGEPAQKPAGAPMFTEVLSSDAGTFWKPKEPVRTAPRPTATGSATVPAPETAATLAKDAEEKATSEKAVEATPVPLRMYAVVPVSSRGRKGPPSATSVPLGPAPEAPSSPVITYTEGAITVTWVASEGVEAYNVYDGSQEAPASPALLPAQLNADLLKAPSFEDKQVAFGKERCYRVTAVDVVAQRRVESTLSPPACVTPVDTFPPPAPTGLAAVAGPATMSLIWDATNVPDLAGYVVLRGIAGGDTLQALTPEPIKDTTYKDVTVTPGTRYVYAVVAVDTAKNRSGQARVEETAR